MKNTLKNNCNNTLKQTQLALFVVLLYRMAVAI